MKKRYKCPVDYYLNEIGRVERIKFKHLRYMELLKLAKKWESDENVRAWMPDFFNSVISEIIKIRLESYKPVSFKENVKNIFNSKER